MFGLGVRKVYLTGTVSLYKLNIQANIEYFHTKNAENNSVGLDICGYLPRPKLVHS